MPKILINEVDYTSAGSSIYSNFAVLIPGFVAEGKGDAFDENGVCEVSTEVEFTDKIGQRYDADHYGNKMAYELVKLGYKILYKKIENGIEDLDEADFWEPLKDKANYDFRYIVTGLLKDNTEASNQICELASYITKNGEIVKDGRGDCTALVDIDDSIYDGKTSKTDIITAIKDAVAGYTGADTYAALFTPAVCYKGYTSKVYKVGDEADNKFPASFHYLACAIRSIQNNFPEWFAVAGYTRGISSFVIDSTTIKIGEAIIDAIQPRVLADNGGITKAVNPIAYIRGNYYLWGNRTAHALDKNGLTAQHFLNIRQLCSTIKKQVYVACRKFTFDPNSYTLWVNLVNAITPTLEAMKVNQGIEDYRIERVATDIKALLKAKIRIIPIEAVEDFEIELSLEDSFGTASVSVTE